MAEDATGPGSRSGAVRFLAEIARAAGSEPARRLLAGTLRHLCHHLSAPSGAAYLLRTDGRLTLRAGFGRPERRLQRALRQAALAALGRGGGPVAGPEGVISWPLACGHRPLGALALAGEVGAADEGLVSALAPVLGLALESCLLRAEARRERRRLAEAHEELREVEELKESFLSGITHDLKTPLVPVVGLIRLLLGGKAGELGERQAEYLAICLRNLDKQLNLIDDLIDYTRAKGGRVHLARERLDLREVVAGSLELLEVMARGRNVTVSAALGEEPLWLEADRGKLARILGNLFSNAVKFNRDGGRVEVRLSRRGGQALLEVEDTGVGMAEGELPRIFERFYKTGDSSGAGLGLSVVKSLVELHGGEVTVESWPGRGSRFRVALRLAAEEKGHEREEDAEAAAAARRGPAPDTQEGAQAAQDKARQARGRKVKDAPAHEPAP